MTFKQVADLVANNLVQIQKQSKLYVTDVDTEGLYNIYLSNLEKDGIFKSIESTEHTCNKCNMFIQRYGNIVGIIDGKIRSIWDVTNSAGEYDKSLAKMTEEVQKSTIKDVFYEDSTFIFNKDIEGYKVLGYESNTKRWTKEEEDRFSNINPQIKAGHTITFHHFYGKVESNYICTTSSAAANKSKSRGLYENFIKTLSFPRKDLETVLELCATKGVLCNGAAKIPLVQRVLQKVVEACEPNNNKNIWVWENLEKDIAVTTFGNTLVGRLVSDIKEKGLEKACDAYNRDEDSKFQGSAPITATAKRITAEFVEANGYTPGLSYRRLATLEDINPLEIKHISHSNSKEEKPVSIFDTVKTTADNKSIEIEEDKIAKISIANFLDIMNTYTSVEALLTINKRPNLCVLTTSSKEDVKPIFKYSNNFCLNFTGGRAGRSEIAQAVHDAGGRVDNVVIGARLIWSEGNSSDLSDLDLHCVEPGGTHIYFSHKHSERTGAFLDVDVINPQDFKNEKRKAAVENIVHTNVDSMPDGVNVYYIKQYRNLGSLGFRAELEVDGQVFTYEYNNPIRTGDNVPIVEVIKQGSKFTVNHKLTPIEIVTSKEVWGLNTNQFHPVKLVCTSPNHWGDNSVGNKYWLFFIEGCKSEEKVNPYHIEHLVSDLMQKPHRRVIQALSESNKLDPSGTNNHLAGLGFNSSGTIEENLVVRVTNKQGKKFLFNIQF